MQYESEHVVLDVEPARGVRLQHERLAKGLRRVVVSLELSEDAYEDASVKCGLRVACGDAALDLLEREAGHLLHDLRRTLHLLTLKSHQRLLRVVEADQLRALSWVIEEPVVLVGEGLADLLVVGVQSHGGVPDSKLVRGW